MPLKDLKGQVFTRLTVIEYVGGRRWNCRCECGNQIETDGADLRRGKTNSCGCLRYERQKATVTRHGHCVGGRSRTADSYHNARQRCLNPNAVNFRQYGSRGVKFLFHSFEHFLSVLGPRPEGTTLGRILDMGNYEPGNCLWMTKREQMLHRRNKTALLRWKLRAA